MPAEKGTNNSMKGLRDALKSGRVANVYIFYGEETYLARAAAQKLTFVPEE